MTIGQDGTVTYVDEAGVTYRCRSNTLAKFPNNGGLTKEGSNYYRQSPSSGEPSPGIALTEGTWNYQLWFPRNVQRRSIRRIY